MSFSCCSKVSYFDIIVIFAFYGFTQSAYNIYINKFANSKKSSDLSLDFLLDTPITKNEEDRVGFEDIVNEVVFLLERLNKSNSFTIGINGKWGSGKSSLLNLLEEKLSDDNYITVKFNSWSHITLNDMFVDFFKILKNRLNEYSLEINSHIENYVKLLMLNSSNAFMKSFGEIFYKEIGKDINEEKKNISDVIKSLNKKIIIFIDELDRLDSIEVMNVLKLIRSISDFDNTIFIVAYDKDYITSAIKKEIDYSNDVYLDKIINLEIDLPVVLNFQSKNIFKRYVDEYEKVNKHNLIELVQKEKILDAYPYNQLFEFSNIRDIKRYTFLLFFKLGLYEKDMLEDSEIANIMLLTYLKLKYYRIYKLLEEKKNFANNSFDKNELDKRIQKKLDDILKDYENYYKTNKFIKDVFMNYSTMDLFKLEFYLISNPNNFNYKSYEKMINCFFDGAIDDKEIDTQIYYVSSEIFAKITRFSNIFLNKIFENNKDKNYEIAIKNLINLGLRFINITDINDYLGILKIEINKFIRNEEIVNRIKKYFIDGLFERSDKKSLSFLLGGMIVKYCETDGFETLLTKEEAQYLVYKIFKEFIENGGNLFLKDNFVVIKACIKDYPNIIIYMDQVIEDLKEYVRNNLDKMVEYFIQQDIENFFEHNRYRINSILLIAFGEFIKENGYQLREKGYNEIKELLKISLDKYSDDVNKKAKIDENLKFLEKYKDNNFISIEYEPKFN